LTLTGVALLTLTGVALLTLTGVALLTLTGDAAPLRCGPLTGDAAPLRCGPLTGVASPLTGVASPMRRRLARTVAPAVVALATRPNAEPSHAPRGVVLTAGAVVGRFALLN
jgi:hypothetical protein